MEKPISLKYADAIIKINPNFNGNVIGNTEEELEINWNGAEEISVADIKAKVSEMETAEENKSASDRAKDKLRTMGFAEDEVALLIHE